jgi:hypothetical protein
MKELKKNSSNTIATSMSLSLNIVEVLSAHWRHHVDVFNNMCFLVTS